MEFVLRFSIEGLFNNIIYQILEDGNQNLWISCNKGIFRVSKKELEDFANGKINAIHCISYGKADGMKSCECNGSNHPAGWKSRDGRLWFPTVEGAAAERIAYYTNLSPGSYRFRVIACNNDGLWNNGGASFHFFLKPFFLPRPIGFTDYVQLFLF